MGFSGVIGIGIELLNWVSSFGYRYWRDFLDFWACLARNSLYTWFILACVGRAWTHLGYVWTVWLAYLGDIGRFCGSLVCDFLEAGWEKMVAQLQKVLRNCQSLTILTSKSFPRHNVVEILGIWAWKSAPTLLIFNDFDVRIAFSPQRNANFATFSATDPPHPPVFGSWFSEPAKPQNYGKIRHFAQFLPAKTYSVVPHLRDRISWLTNFQLDS